MIRLGALFCFVFATLYLGYQELEKAFDQRSHEEQMVLYDDLTTATFILAFAFVIGLAIVTFFADRNNSDSEDNQNGQPREKNGTIFGVIAIISAIIAIVGGALAPFPVTVHSNLPPGYPWAVIFATMFLVGVFVFAFSVGRYVDIKAANENRQES
jgi:heme/copper-type cytochrome/quinol oxidase subunit 2